MARPLTTAEAITGATMLILELQERVAYLKGLTGRPGGHYDGKALTLAERIDAVEHLIELAKATEHASRVIKDVCWPKGKP